MIKEQSAISLDELKRSLPRLLEDTQLELANNVAELTKLFLAGDRRSDVRIKQKEIESQSYKLDQRLLDIQHAIFMADSDKYGQCVACGSSLPLTELARAPATTHCHVCNRKSTAKNFH